ncbi:hypothetical protein [Streptomyces sp. NPDC016845]|uniref:hypothetical protein n=1 Tax=Streptomyces sp. NPDC016845 TaxID=3364972 RepID=UPI003792E15E
MVVMPFMLPYGMAGWGGSPAGGAGPFAVDEERVRRQADKPTRGGRAAQKRRASSSAC